MNIEVGKYYKTRNGLKATIVSKKGHVFRLPILGFISQPDGTDSLETWTAQGSCSASNVLHDHDLMSEWSIDLPEPGAGYRLLRDDEMKLEVGKKYRKGDVVLTVHFIDIGGTAWGQLSTGCAMYVHSDSQCEWTEYTEPKSPQYVPYTWEDHVDLLGRWYKFNDGKCCAMVIKLEIERGVLLINGITAQSFLDNYVWYNDTPCGKEVK